MVDMGVSNELVVELGGSHELVGNELVVELGGSNELAVE